MFDTSSAARCGLRGFRSGFAARALILPAAIFIAALASVDANAVTVTKATDVCASNADPCSVTTVLDIPNGLCTNNSLPCAGNADCVLPGFCKLGAVVLDFGVRDVAVTGAGQFNFGTSSGTILCGDFSASTTGTAIDANGVDASGSDSGTVKIFSRRKCSAAPGFPCLTPTDCQLGACGTRRCAGSSTRACLNDIDCAVGPCIQKGLNKVCTKEESRQCITNADCDLGACPAQLTCKNRAGDAVVNCSSNTDCAFGTCTVGTASITMGGAIVGNSEFPAFLDFRAADNINLKKTINLAGTTADSDGGELSADATNGSVTVEAKVTATSGGFSTGGDISLYAGQDVTITDEIDMTGGDYDGGTIDIDAGRDVTIGRSLLANSGSGAGFGGEFLIVAGRDLVVSGVSAANKTGLETSGHANLFNEAGDGGSQDLSAERNLTLNINTRILSNGSAPDAVGGDIVLDATNNFVFNGDITAKALGANGGGGTLEGYGGGTLSVGSTGTIDLTGGSDAGGDLQLYSTANLTFAGLADLSASNGGSAGSIFLDSNDGDATVSGVLRASSGTNGDIDVSACRVTLTATGQMDSGLTSGDNSITAHESMKLLSGSLMKTGPTGTNTLIYRTAAKPPTISGTVSPTATQIVNGLLSPCPVCGNAEIDGGETCDDGNTANGDGCNNQCQNEKCVTQTAPKIACTTNVDCGSARTCDVPSGFCTPWGLCEDGNVCTTDTCNTALNGGTCQHAAKNCADAFNCTTDSCEASSGNCLHVPNDGACNDQNVCTDDICVVGVGCSQTANDEPCNDNNSCTENDACAAKSCTGTPIDGCGVCGDGQIGGSEACDDGNAVFNKGEDCGVDCMLVPCGKPNGGAGAPNSSDAQYTLRAAVGLVSCCLRVCDVTGDMSIVATDAQRLLRKAVGQSVTLNCPNVICTP